MPTDTIRFEGPSGPGEGVSSVAGAEPLTSTEVSAQPKAEDVKLPPPVIAEFDMGAGEEPSAERTKFLTWLDEWMVELDTDQARKQQEWAKIEEAYQANENALPQISSPPFKGACMDIIPVIAMAVDPIFSRLETGIWGEQPPINVRILRKDMDQYSASLSAFFDAYQKHVMKLRQVMSPRLLELTKLGTMVLKPVFDREVDIGRGYDENFKVIDTEEETYHGPRVLGVSIGDFWFPPNYQHVQQCPIVIERIRTTYDKLKKMEASGKIKNVDLIREQDRVGQRTPLETARQQAVKHEPSTYMREILVYEFWCDYVINGRPCKLIGLYHYDTRVLLSCRFNWYFDQKKHYIVVPYSIMNESLYGRGIGHMTFPFELAITRFHRMASDNAYLANIRMYIARKGIGLEETPTIYTGKTFFVPDPTKDFIPFAAADIYPSTITERQNLFGMVEKVTGVSDYLTGRESPIIGTRATATSTLALIKEGTNRVEEVLGNIRHGAEELFEMCTDIWIQYGTNNIEDKFFEGDQIATDVKEFFRKATRDNIRGMLGVELAATDASTSHIAQQQMQIALIQLMMGYLEKVLEAGQAALMAAQQNPALKDMIVEVMDAARAMFMDLLKKMDIRNWEAYLPDLEKIINAATGPGQGGPGAIAGAPGSAGGNGGQPGVSVGTGPARGPAPPRPATPGAGRPDSVALGLAGASAG